MLEKKFQAGLKIFKECERKGRSLQLCRLFIAHATAYVSASRKGIWCTWLYNNWITKWWLGSSATWIDEGGV